MAKQLPLFARQLRSRREAHPAVICVASVAVVFAERQRKQSVHAEVVNGPILSGQTANVKKHHLSSWRDGTIGAVEEKTVNKFVNPMIAQLPDMTFLNPDEMVEGHIIMNDSKRSTRSHELAGGILHCGPCRDVYWDSKKVKVAIVTNGTICPGMNSVVREITMSLWFQYGVREIFGIQGGFQGVAEKRYDMLTNTSVREIQMKGGCVLKPGRHGSVKATEEEMLDSFKEMGVNMVFVLGGVGGQMEGKRLFDLARERGQQISIVGVSKAIDNDVPFFDKSIGYDSAVGAAVSSITCGWVEASSCANGVGIVKLMGRDSGFICQNAALASTIVDIVLVPEVKWTLEDVFAHVETMFAEKGYCVIAVASGAARSCLGLCGATCRSVAGHDDIGAFLRDAINKKFKPMGGRSFYIDSSYLIRSVPPVPKEAIFCGEMARDAVHTAFRGYTGVCIGSIHTECVAIPMVLLEDSKPHIKVKSSNWQHCVQTCKMPSTLDGSLNGTTVMR